MKQIVYLVLLFGLSLTSCKDPLMEPDAKPEEQFVQIYFKYDFKNELNTFENTYQKDLIADGVIKTKFWLTKEEQDLILQKANEINYFALQDTFKYIPHDSISVSIIPDPGEQKLRIKYHTNDKTIIWTYPGPENNNGFNKLLELQQYIILIIESKPEYKKLPQPKGGYQ